MKFKISLVSQTLEISILLLISIILSLLIFLYDITPLEISIASILWFLLLIVGLFILNEIIVKRLYVYEIEKAGIKESFALISKKEVLIPYSNITRIDLRKSSLGRILNYGDIEISSSASSRIIIRGVRNPEYVYKKIKEMVEKYKNEESE